MVLLPNISKGLGQLEAYMKAEEGVAFQMDNGRFWASLTNQYELSVVGIFPKKVSCKFRITYLDSGKVMLRDLRGLYLSVVEVGEKPSAFPVLPVRYSEDETLQFAVFHRGNKVAFQAYNGLFLARVFREFHVLEAAKIFADDSCLFRPLIGDLSPPTLEIMNVVPKDLSQLQFHWQLMEKKYYVNQTKIPVKHTFKMNWKGRCTDTIIWERLWGLGLPSTCSFTVERVKPTVVYTKDNEHLLSVEREIFEKVRKEVEVPPKTKVIARFYVHGNYNASLPFTATIRKLKHDGMEEISNENGAWMGLVYQDFRVECSHIKLAELCTTM